MPDPAQAEAVKAARKRKAKPELTPAENAARTRAKLGVQDPMDPKFPTWNPPPVKRT